MEDNGEVVDVGSRRSKWDPRQMESSAIWGICNN